MTEYKNNTLSLRATTKIRNDALISKREELGLNQRQAATLCGVGYTKYINYEKLVFPDYYDETEIEKISGTFDIPKDKIFPPSLIGVEFRHTTVKRREIPIDRLLEYKESQTRHLLKSSEDIAAQKDDFELLFKYVDKLKPQQRDVIIMMYGLGGTPALSLTETAKKMRLGCERTRQIESRAIRELQGMHYRNRDLNINLRQYKDKISL